MKKRVLSVLLIVALFVSCLAFSASAEGTPTLRLSNVSAGRGDEVTVDIVMEDNPGVMGITLTVSYDQTRLQLISLNDGVLTGWFVSTGAVGKAAWTGSSDYTGNGVILTLKFKVLDEAPLGDAFVTITEQLNSNYDEQEVKYTVVPGNVNVACAHEWDEGVVTKEPTCAEEGVKTFTCSKCNETRTESMKKAEHSSDGGKVTKQPTCTEKGVKTYTCKVCGEVLKTEEVPAKGHQSDGGKVTKEPTCTEKGVKTYTCTVCGGVIKTEEVPAKGHQSDGGKVTTEPTCTEKGVKTYTCKVCGEVLKTEEVPATGHQSDGGKVTTAPTCTEKGVKTYTCTVCGEVLKTEEIPALGHTWNEGEITAEATCTEDGSMHFICTVCQTEKDEVIEAPGHDWDEGKVVKEATETQDGLKEFTCKVCEETKQESYKYSVATGDEAMPVLFTLLLVASAGAVVVLTRKLRKERG